jgi:hypothetical protein
MISESLRSALEAYHRKRWFSAQEPDRFGAFVDFVSLETVHDLVQNYKQSGDVSLLSVAYYIYRIIKELKLADLFRQRERAYGEELGRPGVLPSYGFYYIRSFPRAESSELWNSWQSWSQKWENLLGDWLDGRLELEQNFRELNKEYQTALGYLPPDFVVRIEKDLRSSRDLFELRLRQQSTAVTVPDLLQFLRLSQADGIADWNDFLALAASLQENFQFLKTPVVQKTQGNPAFQGVFPISPPERVIVEYGTAAGPLDSLRFVFEWTKACFYAGMNPKLPAELRIAGDPALPYFWSSLYCNAFATPAGLSSMVSPAAEGLQEPLQLALHFWYRYDAVLALYQQQIYNAGLRQAQDLYVHTFDAGFALEPLAFLYLYDLDRAEEALFRFAATAISIGIEEQLRALYGRRWFASPKWRAKIQEYWWHGYGLSLGDVLNDMNMPRSLDSYLFTLS